MFPMTYKVLLATKTIQSIVYRHSLDSISILVVIMPCRMCSKMEKNCILGKAYTVCLKANSLIFFSEVIKGTVEKRKSNDVDFSL